MTIEICNLRKGRPNKIYDVRCDRANKVLGNHPGQGKPRIAAIAAFKTHLDKELSASGSNDTKLAIKDLASLYETHGKLRLWCWCAPQACHTQLIRDAVYDLMG